MTAKFMRKYLLNIFKIPSCLKQANMPSFPAFSIDFVKKDKRGKRWCSVNVSTFFLFFWFLQTNKICWWAKKTDSRVHFIQFFHLNFCNPNMPLTSNAAKKQPWSIGANLLFNLGLEGSSSNRNIVRTTRENFKISNENI